MRVFLWVLVVGGLIVGIEDYRREFISDLEAITILFSDLSIILTGLYEINTRTLEDRS
jgi:hypothetical protein